ncbi:MAG: putative K(+)-stimulated pyrophosphate-energized sodium pump [candidate division TA06 bacterium ADurb.Bin131]|uniref:K(+)-insensitive pyrophosphate-energized proton pump n=1 Tax=candidate division TA06 bacterium ADurb.Bin131 TaxID=1852827 RepID=A0A1V6C9Y6_UNCT6|nr:MAG: putative K(+)-stimulated pyrophosphate-energized sodium pump [candidate division TA06 bacterium ADurb.Bin131]HRV03446.1 sodium-translocating pyrophosphatase [Candidatus Ratteibacteria bacterium]
MYFNLVILVSVASIVIAFLFALDILRKDSGNEKMQEISNAIKEGANAFLKRQYTTIAILSIALALIIFLIYALSGKFSYGWHTSLAFILGALCSSISGFVGMYISVRSNVRTAAAAGRSMNEAVVISLRGGAVSGILVVALSLLGVAGIFLLYGGTSDPVQVPLLIVGFGFGASFVALFAQLGGGIYTKAADVGADLVGKVEAGIPEDDPRNPAVIADLVGDNVGDCAGRGADLFESTAAENIGAMILGIALYPIFGIYGIIFPLVARAFGLIASIIGVMCVRVSETEDPMAGLNRGYLITTILAAIGFWVSTKLLLTDYHTYFFLAGLVGILTSFAFVSITQYYTEYRYRPVKEIARASETGPATNIIAGFSVGLECTGLPVLVISVALLLAYYLGKATGLSAGGLYGTAVATMGMLSTCAYILAMDTFGPITDNAGGIVEMSGASENIRKRTDRLDAIGNTTKALTKGYAVGSAALAAFLLFSAYLEDVHLSSVDLAKPVVFIGGMLGAVLVFIFSSFAIRAVGNAAYYIINNVRKQFKEKPGILQGKEKPDYAQAVDICTRGALKEMILPGLTAVIVPLLVGLFLGPEAVGATLMVGTIAGIILALVLNNGGGAWDNAKKYIEAGAYGGKGSDTHKAAVVGDTVGDPFKDTAGPSLHVLVKLLSTLTLVFAPLFLILHAVK